MKKVKTRDFGIVEIEEEQIITFPQGIPGFVDYKEFIILPLAEDSPFLILQSVREEELAFITLNPWEVVSDYEFEISDSVEKQLRIKSEEELMVLVIGTLHEKIEDLTVNLAAPLVINIKAALGKQVILEDSGYPVRYPAFKRKLGQVSGEC